MRINSLMIKSKKLRRIFSIAVIVLILVMLIVGYATGQFDEFLSGFSQKLLDPDDISLDTISDEDILKPTYGYRSYVSGTRKSGSTSGVTGFYNNVDRASMKEHAKKADGILTLMSTRVENGTLKLDISNKLESGDMLVVIIKDDQIVDRFEGAGEMHYEYEVEAESIFLVRCVCKNARFEISSVREIVGK